jgi:hypothetical protein
VEKPVFCDGVLYFIVADFAEKLIQVVAFNTEDFEQRTVFELPLDEVPSCYNLRVEVAPAMLLCEREEHVMQVLWPEKKKFKLKDREVLNFRDGDKVYSSEWFEEEEPDYNYHEQVVVRDWETGEEIERFDGQMHRMPNGDVWRF